MNKVRFSSASKSEILDQDIANGKFYVSSDTKELYCDTLDGARIKISDIELVNNDSERLGLLAPLNKFYYVLDTNKLWYYNKSWIQIGPGNPLIIKVNGIQKAIYDGSDDVEVNITKSDIGLGNVPNVSTNDQTPTYTSSSTLTELVSGEKLSIAFGKISKAIKDLISHIGNKNNPHGVTKSQISLGNVTNDKQIKGLSTGTTENHVLIFGSDGYTVKDSGFTIGKSVPSNAVFTDTNTWIAFKGATASSAGTAGYVPAPSAGSSNRYFRSDGTWSDINLSTFGITVSASEINYLDGVSSNIQKQIDSKSPSTHTHNYAGSSSEGGAANSVKTSIIVKLNSGTTEGTNMFTFNGSVAKTINITPSSIGAAASSHGTHVTFSTTAPLAPGTASAGSASTVARSDHRHPLQTSVAGSSGSCTGNSATATKLLTARTINGVSFDGSQNITIGIDDGVIS